MIETKNTSEEQLKLSLTEYEVPTQLHGGLLRYVISGLTPGGFLRAVLSNDLILAVLKADDDLTIAELRVLVRWLHNCAPSQCHGSHGIVADWIRAKEKELGVAR